MVDAQSRLQAHFDQRAPSYASATPWVTDPHSLEPIYQFVAGTAARRALEIGIGSGAVPDYLRSRGLRPQVYAGLDVSAAMLQHAQGWSPVQGDASHLPIRGATIDLVVVRQAFHYFERPSHVLAEISRVLTEHGALLVAQITPFDHDADVEWWSRAVALRQPLRRHLWTAASLDEALRASGFTVEAVLKIAGRSSLRNWLHRYPIEEGAAQELFAHYRRAPNRVRAIRDFELRPDGDIHFAIRWSILFGRRSGAETEPRAFHVSR